MPYLRLPELIFSRCKDVRPAIVQVQKLGDIQTGMRRVEKAKKAQYSPPPTIEDTVPSSTKYEGQTYHFQNVLGQGAFGTVRRAVIEGSGRLVAVKIINCSMAFIDGIPIADSASSEDNDVWTGDLQREYRALRVVMKVKSPFLTNVEAMFQDQGRVYFVMELYPASLQQHLDARGGPLKIEEIRLMAAELICGLDALHQKGCFHCDIKPDNIMVTETGHIALVDFGIAEVPKKTSILPAAIRGTPEYMAPEIHDEKSYDGAKADIYSAGVVIHEMYVGSKQAFGSGNVVRLDVKGMDRNAAARNLIVGMLAVTPKARLSIVDIQNHEFFVQLDWHTVKTLGYTPGPIPDNDHGKRKAASGMPTPPSFHRVPKRMKAHENLESAAAMPSPVVRLREPKGKRERALKEERRKFVLPVGGANMI
ncbi:kinase-like protein [Cylindrobasidium torrendii FP15055 ss-10]|uniref:Kinase-like protein n=1 Tax=Cylindrobasidium torrendii FP15055 ss-10 TaxID=1314674 RepID=A0A0D7BS50_9AGAR|nr:kinase-like protein [Cylindrobasidium torrendii FP15055 ss-10]